jgi:hypothetical protein
VTPDDLVEAAVASYETLEEARDGDWSRRAGSLEWTCRRTLDHVPDTLLLYAAHLASRTARPLPFLRNGDPEAPVRHLLRSVQSAAAILADVARAAAPVDRAYHPAGMADPSGFVAMGCDEILVHTHDIADGLELPFAAPRELCTSVLGRLFPWAPTDLSDVEPWSVLLWANGRGQLPGHPQLDPDWYWYCAPVEEWDGTVSRRASPPGWR